MVLCSLIIPLHSQAYKKEVSRIVPTIQAGPGLLKAHNKMFEMRRCYREIYEEKTKVIVQSSLDKFVRKTERPVSSTSRQPSTSFSEPE
jgi:hypothetical protein